MSDLADDVPPEPPGRILTLDAVADVVQLSARTGAILAGALDASHLTPRRGGWPVYESALAGWPTRRSNSTRGPHELRAALDPLTDGPPAASVARQQQRPPHNPPRPAVSDLTAAPPPHSGLQRRTVAT